MKTDYAWYLLRPFPEIINEKHDDVRDKDLRMLCSTIDDVLLCVFHLPSSGTSIYMRVPREYGKTVESISTFGHELQQYPVITRVGMVVQFKLKKKPVFPLVTDTKEIPHNIFSMLSHAPYGVFCVKLLHSPAKTVQQQFQRHHKKYAEKKDKDNLHARVLKSKAECNVFYYADIMYGVQDVDKAESFENAIPCVGKAKEPNALVRRAATKNNKRNKDKATDRLRKFMLARPKKGNMILSADDILPFVCFPADTSHMRMEAAPADASLNFASTEELVDPKAAFMESQEEWEDMPPRPLSQQEQQDLPEERQGEQEQQQPPPSPQEQQEPPAEQQGGQDQPEPRQQARDEQQ